MSSPATAPSPRADPPYIKRTVDEREQHDARGGGGGPSDDESQPGPSSYKRPRLDTPPDEIATSEVEVVLPGPTSDVCQDACCGGGMVDKGKGREEVGLPAADDAAILPSDDKLLATDDASADGQLVNSSMAKLERLVEELEDELSCPICSAVLYKPVTIQPGCGHAFCGACLHSYLTASSPTPHVCPSCRTTSTSASHSRIVSTMVDVLISHAPDRARAQNEKDQADVVWDVGMSLRFGNPPPPPERVRLSECYRPCRHCSPNNGYGWSCPIPVPSIDSDGPHYPLDGPTPPGHFQCASCSRLAASEAPGTTSCSICEAHYCGAPGGHYHSVGGEGVCSPESFESSAPTQGLWGRSAIDLSDAIMDGQSDEMMNAFRDNLEEISIFARYIGTHLEHTPAALWAEMLEWIRSDEGKAKGGVKGIFRRTDENIHYSFRGETPTRTCKACTDDIFACGLYEWWERKRPTVLSQLDKEVQRADCVRGRACFRQGSAEHAKKFNHVCAPAPPDVVEASHQDEGTPAAVPLGSTPSHTSSAGPLAASSALPPSGASSMSLSVQDASLESNGSSSLAAHSTSSADNTSHAAAPTATSASATADAALEALHVEQDDPDATMVVDEPEAALKLEGLTSAAESAVDMGDALPLNLEPLPVEPAVIAAV